MIRTPVLFGIQFCNGAATVYFFSLNILELIFLCRDCIFFRKLPCILCENLLFFIRQHIIPDDFLTIQHFTLECFQRFDFLNHGFDLLWRIDIILRQGVIQFYGFRMKLLIVLTGLDKVVVFFFNQRQQFGCLVQQNGFTVLQIIKTLDVGSGFFRRITCHCLEIDFCFVYRIMQALIASLNGFPGVFFSLNLRIADLRFCDVCTHRFLQGDCFPETVYIRRFGFKLLLNQTVSFRNFYIVEPLLFLFDRVFNTMKVFIGSRDLIQLHIIWKPVMKTSHDLCQIRIQL